MGIMRDLINSKNKDTTNVIKNIANAVLIKGGGIIVGLLTTPAYMNFFKSQEILGVWFTILSVITWMLNFDMGIGNGLRNRLVEELTLGKDEKKIKKLVSSAYIFLISISLVVGMGILVVIRYEDWNSFFGLDRALLSEAELQVAVEIVMLSIFLQLVLRLVTSIEFALQKSYVANLLLFITNTIILIYVLIANVTGKNNNIIALSIAYLLAVNVPLVITTVHLFATQMKYARPNLKLFDISCAFDTLKLGGLFLFIQLEAMLINNSSIILITKLCGPASVVEYNIYFKVFSMVNTFYSLFTIPIWSAITKAMTNQDYLWIKKTLRVLQIVAIVFSIGQLMVMPIMQFLFDIWLGDKSITVNYTIMLCFALEQLFMVWSNLNAAICNGLNQLKFQLIYMTIGIIIMFTSSICLTHFSKNYSMVVIAHCFALAPYCLSQSTWLEKFIKKNTTEDMR